MPAGLCICIAKKGRILPTEGRSEVLPEGKQSNHRNKDAGLEPEESQLLGGHQLEKVEPDPSSLDTQLSYGEVTNQETGIKVHSTRLYRAANLLM